MADRDPIIQPTKGGGSPTRADKLNGTPRTKSIDGGGANYSPQKSSKVNGAPPPNNPYKGG